MRGRGGSDGSDGGIAGGAGFELELKGSESPATVRRMPTAATPHIATPHIARTVASFRPHLCLAFCSVFGVGCALLMIVSVYNTPMTPSSLATLILDCIFDLKGAALGAAALEVAALEVAELTAAAAALEAAEITAA